MEKIVFNQEYYENIMKDFGYNPFRFNKIDFSLGSLTEEDIQRRWLCHHNGNIFSDYFIKGEKVIVSTGFGLSGIPHTGTLSQILRAIALQKAGIPVNIVLGDLDAYNGKDIPLEKTLELADKYKSYIVNLGFDESPPSTLRSQFNALDVLRTSYIIGHYMDDKMFKESEEDLHRFYYERGKVDSGMSYRRKLSLNLMTADFLHLHMESGFKGVLVMLGIDEHKYILFTRKIVEKIKQDSHKNIDMVLGGLYSPLIKGFYNYPKMSKSFPDSGISVDMNSDEIRKKISKGEGDYNKPENNVIYQMMASASFLDNSELMKNYEACLEGGQVWKNAKERYTEMLIDICSRWEK